MENRLQHVLLALGKSALLPLFLTLSAASVAEQQSNADEKGAGIDTEFFELGAFIGIINIEDFASEPVVGIRSSFHATEDIFLQFNFGSAEVSRSSYEKNAVDLVDSSDRDYRYVDLLLGYNLFPGEVFPSSARSALSAFHLVAGLGHTEFGGEENFTYIFGAGYRISVSDRLLWHVDLRDHLYKTNLIQKNETVHNIDLTTGLTYLF